LFFLAMWGRYLKSAIMLVSHIGRVQPAGKYIAKDDYTNVL
jgi:hypothetical protein